MAQKFCGVRAGINVTNPFTAAGDATLVQCDNMQHETPGVMRSRRGLAAQPASLPNFITALRSTALSEDDFFSHRDGNVLAYGDGTAWTNVGNGSLENADLGRRMRVMSYGQQHYFTSDNGVKVAPLDNSDLQFAGMCMGINPDFNNTPAFSAPPGPYPGAMPNGTEGAWRICFVRRRQDTSEVRGSPSGRMVFRNGTGITQDVIIRVTLGKQQNTDTTDFVGDGTEFIEVYRSLFRPFANGNPDDEMRLVWKQAITVGDVAAGFIDVIDTTPNEVWERGPLLYTNPNSGEVGGIAPNGQPIRGILLENETPPMARDVASFVNRAWYAETVTRASKTIEMFSVPAAGGELIIAGTLYTATAAFPPLVDEFTVGAFGDLSRDLAFTAQSLCSAINTSPTNTTVWANYVGESETSPGLILIQARSFNYTFTMDDTSGAVFPAAACFQPPLVELGTIQGEDFKNGLFFSKVDQPEAVPPPNYFRIGGPNATLLRIVPLRESLFCFTDEGVYRVTGDNESTFAVQLLDARFRCISRESVIVGSDEKIYAWGDQGIAAIDEGGAAYISTPIDSLVRFFQTRLDPTSIMRTWFAVASPVWQWVAFWYSSNTSGCLTAFVWNIPSGTWTTFTLRQLPGSGESGLKSCGCTQVNTGRTAYGKRGATSWVFFEQINFNDAYWTDVSSDAVNAGIVQTLTWHPLQESPPVMCHWREVHAAGQLNTLLPDAWPATLPVQMTTGTGVTVVDNPVPYNVAQQGDVWAINARAIVGTPARRAIRFSPGLLTPGTDAACSLPVEGVTVLYEPYSERAGK